LDDGDGVTAVLEERIDVVLEAELSPSDPKHICCFGTFRSDPKLGLFLDKDEISAEIISFCRWYMLQGVV
jgi:hypothetical protein